MLFCEDYKPIPMPREHGSIPATNHSTRSAAYHTGATGIAMPAVIPFQKMSLDAENQPFVDNSGPVVQLVLSKEEARAGVGAAVDINEGGKITKGVIFKFMEALNTVKVKVDGEKNLRLVSLDKLSFREEGKRGGNNEDQRPALLGQIAELWGRDVAPPVVGKMNTLTPEELNTIEELHRGFEGYPPKTDDRTVYIRPGSWDDGEGVFLTTFGSSTMTGSAQLSDRMRTAKKGGITAILREKNSASHIINATIELQIGRHHIEYKWERTTGEQAAEEERVSRWDPDSAEERESAAQIYRRFALGQADPDKEYTNELVGGSAGLEEAPKYASVEAFMADRHNRGLFKPKALSYFRRLPENQKLLFINRNFAGSKIATQIPHEENGNGMTNRDVVMESGYADVQNVYSYLSNKINTADKEMEKLKEESRPYETTGNIKKWYQKQFNELKKKLRSKKFGNTAMPSQSVGGDNFKLLSVESLFWDRFMRLSADAQIEMIGGATTAIHQSTKSPLEQAAALHYVRNEGQENREHTSTVKISNVTFTIGSGHAYRFHQQGLHTHPGIAGTQKEVEFAIMNQVLQRYWAKSLPRSGAVGGIAESENFVMVNGVKIIYLAWSPNPVSDVIYIPDYMAAP